VAKSESSDEKFRRENLVYNAYEDRWRQIVNAEPRFERDGRRKVLSHDGGLEGYKQGLMGKLEQKIQLMCPSNDFVLDYIEANAAFGFPMARPGEKEGRTVYICGNGRGLPDHVKHLDKHGQGDDVDVWACNGALNWLHENGHKVTHGFTTDTSARMWQECWINPAPVYYVLATCVDTRTIDQVMAAGAKGVTFFHNFTGVYNDERGYGEIQLYQSLYPSAPLVGEGLNSVNRAVALADMMGYKKIVLMGCVKHLDPKSKHHHADGGASTQQYTLTAQIDGRTYSTHADLLYSAIDLVKQERRFNGTIPKADWRRLSYKERSNYVDQGDGTCMPRGREKRMEFVGHRNDLGMVLRRKSDSFLKRCIRFGEKDPTVEEHEDVKADKTPACATVVNVS
jgi:hypothetical protein